MVGLSEKSLEELQGLKQTIEDEIISRREDCPHERVVYEYGYAEGWGRSEDSYWVDVECLNCGSKFKYDAKEQLELYNLEGATLGSGLKVTKDEYKVLLKFGKV